MKKEEIIKQIISSHQNNIINNKQIGEKNMTNNKTTMEETEVWVSRTKSGKGFIIAVEKGTPPGTVFVGSIANLRKMIEGEHKGVKLSKFTQE